jgi:hypothetical protein
VLIEETGMVLFVQLVIVGTWGAALLIHTRRLLRMATVSAAHNPHNQIREKAQRIWWWLGRNEFWQVTCTDVVRCLEVTLMVVILAWGL